MKKYLSKQLMMLAILLLSGIGGAFAKEGTFSITATWNYPESNSEVYFSMDGLPDVSAESGKACALSKGRKYYRLNIYIPNPSIYSISSIIIDNNGEDVKSQYYTEEGITFKDDTDHSVAITLAKAETQTITVNWPNENNYGTVRFQDENYNTIEASYSDGATSTTVELAKGKNYKMYVHSYNPLCWSVSSVKENDENIVCDEQGAYSFINLNEDHTIAVAFTERSITKKNITVNFIDYTNAGIGIHILNGEEVGEGVGLRNDESFEVAAGEGFNYRVFVYLDNSQQYGIYKIQLGGTEVEFSKTSDGGYFDIIDLTEDTTVTVTLIEKETKTVTVNWVDECNFIDIWDQYNYSIGTQSYSPEDKKGVWVLSKDSTYRLNIALSNPSDYFATVTIGEGDPVNATYNEKSGWYEYVIENLSDNLIITISAVAIPTNKIAVSWVDGCNSIEMYNQYNGYIEPQSYSPEDKKGVWVLPTGSTYRLVIGLSDSEDYFATVKIGDGEPVNATYNDYYNRYEYDIEELASDLNIAVSAVAKPTNEIAVTCTYLDALNIEIVDQENGNLYQLDEDGKVNLKPGKTYRMYINNRVPEVYSLNSITLDGTTDYVGNFTDENGENDYIEFADLDADHTVAITLNKKASDTIIVNRNRDLVRTTLYKVDEWSWDWINSKSESESKIEWEVLSNQKYRIELGVQNPLTDEITSVIIDKGTEGEIDITSNFTDDNNDNNYFVFAEISANHTIDVKATKQGETKQFTLKAFFDNGNGEERIWYGEYSDIELYDQAKEKMIEAGESFELLTGSTTQLMITPHTGYKVKTIMVDKDDVTEAFNTNNGYYEFTNLDAGHSIKVVFEVATTHYVKVTSNIEAGQFIVEAKGAYYDNRFNTELNFNEGTNVTMRVDSLDSKWDNENYCWIKYKLTKIMDGETDITPSTSNGNSQYEVFFNNLSADHNVKLIYELIPNYNVTVTFNGIGVQLESSDNDIWISSEEPYKYEVGESVKLILSIGIGQKISVTVNGTPVDYTAGGIVLTDSISENIVVNITTEEVPTFSVDTEFIGYSQGTVYMEADLFEKRETYGNRFNAGSNVTVTIVPSIGYEVSKLVLAKKIDNEPRVETTVDAVYNEVNKEYTYVIENLENNCRLRITTAKRSMAGIDPQPYTLGENGMGTYCSEYDLDFSGLDGITAYIASGFDPVEGYVVLTKVFKVPAGTGIIIKGTPGDYSIPVVATNFFYRNMLVGVVKATPVPQTDRKDVEYTNYILLKKDSDTEPTFYRSDGSGDMPANRAYLQIPSNLVPSANNARITTVFEDEVTPVEDILTTSDNSKDDYYNLNGQKVQTVNKGIYIKNGKKVIIR